jgi:uncharacterized protein YkwD
MSRNSFIKNRNIIYACYSLIIVLLIIVSIPTQALANADNRSNKSSSILSQEWRSVVGTSMTTLKQVITGNMNVDNPQEDVLSVEEAQMISLINQERAKAGLKELIIDYSLVKLAKEKSMDMVSHNYFGHISPRLGTIYDQLQREQILYQSVAENLAGTANTRKAQQYLFTSPSHRWNILNPSFTKVGVGIIRGGPFGAMITQLFLG